LEFINTGVPSMFFSIGVYEPERVAAAREGTGPQLPADPTAEEVLSEGWGSAASDPGRQPGRAGGQHFRNWPKAADLWRCSKSAAIWGTADVTLTLLG
jgi:hypothetical protein